jgi:hypothetical protein
VRDAATVRRAVARRLHASRGLCEDYEVQVLDSQEVEVAARVEIGSVDHPERVLLDIYRRIEEYLSPPVPLATLDEMLAAGKRVDEIFDGPLLAGGFVDDEKLQSSTRRTAIYTSDLIHEIMNASNVRAVRDIAVSTRGGAPRAWSLDVEPDSVPRLSLAQPRITLERDGLAVGVDRAGVLRAYAEGIGRGPAERNQAGQNRLAPNRGRDRHAGRYRSIQHQFPALYGVGEMGLPDSAPPARRAQAKQLSAFLLLFDQLLANAFAQLAGARELFSFEAGSLRTYFAQAIDDPALLGLVASNPEAHGSWLDENVETTLRTPSNEPLAPTTSPQRKNRFMNHLLARFGEQFTDYSLVLADAMPTGSDSALEKLARDKQAFLKRCARVGSARGTAFNYLEPRGGGNVSGLEERIRLKLGLVEAEDERFYLVEHILLRPLEEDARQLSPAEEGGELWEPQVPLLTDAGDRDPYSLQVSFVFPSGPARFRASGPTGEPATFRAFIEQTIREETPAHLTCYVHWLEGPAWAHFETSYHDWLERHRKYWAERLGV